MKTTLVALTLLVATSAFGAQHTKISPLGASSKGQYVAFEEYGMNTDKKSFFVTIKIMNVWKKTYVGKPVELVIPVEGETKIEDVRQKAKDLATEQLTKFNISG